VLGNRLSYYWTLWQSEVAKDYIFESNVNKFSEIVVGNK